MFFILLVTQATLKKNPSSPNRSRTYDLLVTSPDAYESSTSPDAYESYTSPDAYDDVSLIKQDKSI